MACAWPERIREIGVANIGHRGASAYAPENTIPALQLAFQQGAHAVEFDVRLTRDRVAVVLHDDRVDRTTDGTGLAGEMGSDELRALDAGSWFSDEFTGEPVPTLAEALRAIPPEGLINVELKGGPWTDEDLEEGILEALRDPRMARRVVISSYQVETIRRMSALSSLCGTSLRVRVDGDGELDLESLVGVCQCVNLEAKAIEPATVQQLHELGFVVETYTVNDAEEMKRLVAMGVDALFTDRPDILARLLNARSGRD